MKHTIIDIYLDYINNFLTVTNFALYYSISYDFALSLIKEGERLNDLTNVKDNID